MSGKNVLHPMGCDAFGLPAEQYAIETGVHPRVTTEKNIANIRRQLKMLGFSYDWDASSPRPTSRYFRWTQWIFLQLFDTWFDEDADRARPIAELSRSSSPTRSTAGRSSTSAAARAGRRAPPGLPGRGAGELVPGAGHGAGQRGSHRDGRSERGGHPVYRRPLRQWMLRITAYADRLLDDLDLLDWSEGIKLMQRNWIGRSTGAEVDFGVEGHEDTAITVFTTRPDTLFGATYMVARARAPARRRHRARHDWPGAMFGERLERHPASSGRASSAPTSVRPRRSQATASSAAAKSDLDRRPSWQGEDRRLHRLRTRSIRSTASRSRSGSPTTC